MRGEEIHAEFWRRNLNEREDLGVDERLWAGFTCLRVGATGGLL
jgi:hypothetical protein